MISVLVLCGRKINRWEFEELFKDVLPIENIADLNPEDESLIVGERDGSF